VKIDQVRPFLAVPVLTTSKDYVNHSQVGNVFMLGAGGVFVVALSAYFGRLPILFYFLVLAVATAIWCAAAVTFESFMAARILNGFFSTVAQGGGLMFIYDMVCLHCFVYDVHDLYLQSPLLIQISSSSTNELGKSMFGRPS
jgi:MFS family permease